MDACNAQYCYFFSICGAPFWKIRVKISMAFSGQVLSPYLLFGSLFFLNFQLFVFYYRYIPISSVLLPVIR